MFREFVDHDDYDVDVPIVFSTTRPVLFSILNDTTFNKAWEPWKERYFELKQNSTLIYRKTKDKSIIKRLDLTDTKISKMALKVSSPTNGSSLQDEIGIIVSCKHNGFETMFRCILTEAELHDFLSVVQLYVMNPTIEFDALHLENIRKSQRTHSQSAQSMNAIINIFNESSRSISSILPHVVTSTFSSSSSSKPAEDQASFMRQSLMQAMDKHSRRTKWEQILHRRGG